MEKQLSLRKDKDFKRVYKKSRAFRNRDFTILIKNNDQKTPRFGFSISKKIGKANVRNKLKRRLREIVRSSYSDINCVDLVIIPKAKCADYDFYALKASFDHCMNKAFKAKRIYHVK